MIFFYIELALHHRSTKETPVFCRPNNEIVGMTFIATLKEATETPAQVFSFEFCKDLRKLIS